MPNHIQSIVTIHGDKNALQRVMDKILVTESYLDEVKQRNETAADGFKIKVPDLGTLSFNRLIPQPTDIFQGNLGREEEEKYGKNKCWYDWRVSNWGTKWDCYCVEIEPIDDNSVQLLFQTAWSAPTKYMEQLAKVCAGDGCTLDGMFCDEDFASNMGEYRTNDNGELDIVWHDEDAELYEACWGWNPLEDDMEEE